MPPGVVNSGPRWDKMKGTLKLQSKHWIVDSEGHIIMGEGRKKILEAIEKTASMNQAAKLMKMSYKAVWGKLKATEDYLDVKIVEKDRKTGTQLTEEGKALLERYSSLKEQCMEADDRLFNDIFEREGR